MRIRWAALIVFFFILIGVPATSQAGRLLSVSDTISNSAPSTVSNHTIQFRTNSAVPPSGKIVLTPESLSVDIPAGFTFLDVDVAVATSAPYTFIDRTLAAVPTAVADGVSVTSGTSGQIEIVLNSTTGIASGETVQIELGLNATTGAAGSAQWTNPAATGSYTIDVVTQDASSAEIDSTKAVIAIINSIHVGDIEIVPQIPNIFNGLPTGELLSGTVAAVMSVETDILANCKYNLLPGIPYASSTDLFPTGFTQIHMVTLTGLTDDTTHTYYIRCEGGPGLATTTDYVLTFSIEPTPGTGPTSTTPVSPLSGGGSGYSGTGGGLPGGNFAQKAKVIFDGWGPPLSDITLMKDGTRETSFTVGSDGHFNTEVANLERGTYTFSIYSIDTDGRRSTTYTTSIAIISNTTNAITNIYVPPTIEIEEDTLDPGEPVNAFGQATPFTTIEAFLNTQGEALSGNILFATTTVDATGRWSVTFDTDGLDLDTYELKARVKLPDTDSDFSKVIYIGLGGAPDPDFGNFADLNQDGFVNITDFSILLFWWGTDGGDSNPPADINRDGTVNLTDFSIMIFHWTG